MTTCTLKIRNGKSECRHCPEIRISLRIEGRFAFGRVADFAFFLIPFPTLFSRLKKSGEQVDDRIVEVHWDPDISRWRMMRFRDDKPHGNHRSVVENIIQSIADGVEKEAVRQIS